MTMSWKMYEYKNNIFNVKKLLILGHKEKRELFVHLIALVGE